MLNSVEWGEFKLGDLFKIENTLSFNKDRLTSGFGYDYVTRTSQNQGILQETGWVNDENINSAGTWSLGLLQMDFFYRKRPWYAGQFVRKIIAKNKIPKGAVHYFTTLLNKQKKDLLSVLVRNVDDKFKSCLVQLPTKNNQPDYDFMQRFIEQLEQDYIQRLDSYLEVTGLKNTELTEAEQKALAEFEQWEWREFKMGDLFEKIQTKKLPFKADELPKQIMGKYTLPCLTSSFQNQGLNYYVPREGATILKNVISIPSNSDVYRAYLQSNEFTVLSDAYAIRWIFTNNELLPSQYLFAVQCINKVTDLPLYSYKSKLGGWNVVKDKYIQLPATANQPDYGKMELLISAIQKLVIRDVVQYADDNLLT